MRRILAAAAVACLLLSPAHAVRVEQVTSPGGIRAWLMPSPAVPVVAMSFSFRGAGSASEPADKAGVANMVSALLDEGAGARDSAAFQEALSDISASLSFDAGRDDFDGTLYALSESFGAGAALLGDALARPRFDPPAVGRIRDAISLHIRRRGEQAHRIAYRTWFRGAFAGHPYARAVVGTAETVAGITRSDLAGYAERRFARDNLIVGVAGDIAPEALGRALDAAFAHLPAGAGPAVPPEAGLRTYGGLQVIRRPGPQTVYVFGHGGLKRDHPDWFAARLVMYVLGGSGPVSRLNEAVRERRGLAYSIHASLVPYDRGALVLGSAATGNERAGETLATIRNEWRRLAGQGMDADELAAAKRYLTGAFPISLTGTGRLADLAVALQRHGLGPDYPARRAELIARVGLADANRVARTLLDPDRLTVVAVGGPEGLE